MPKKGGSANHGQGKIVKASYATTIVESRMLDLIKNGKVARAHFTAGAGRGLAHAVEQQLIAPACGVQLWRLDVAVCAVVWVNASHDNVTLFRHMADAHGHYLQVVADLQAKHAIPLPDGRRPLTRKEIRL